MRDLLPTLRMLAQPVASSLGRWLRRLIVACGALALVLIVLAGTRIPFDIHRWLGSAAGECKAATERIVVLGGSGLPSGPELLRLHRAAELAQQMPLAEITIIHPGDTAMLGMMVQELRLRGVAGDRITTLNEGDNTRGQALAFVRVNPFQKPQIALVTAPENMYRSVLTFRKAGMNRVCGVPAWEHAMDHRFDYAHQAIGGKVWLPDISEETNLRYTFWNYLKLEITCLREFVAIAYYRLNGWI